MKAADAIAERRVGVGPIEFSTPSERAEYQRLCAEQLRAAQLRCLLNQPSDGDRRRIVRALSARYSRDYILQLRMDCYAALGRSIGAVA